MDMAVNSQDKLNVLQPQFVAIMDALGPLSEDGTFTADDVIEVFAMGIAVMIDNDPLLASDEQIERAVDTSAALIRQRAKDFRQLHERTGLSIYGMFERDIPVGMSAAS